MNRPINPRARKTSLRAQRFSSIERLEDRRLFAVLQNADNPLDVDRSGLVTAFDALLVINELNAHDLSRLEGRPWVGSVDRFCDVNGDESITAIDALDVMHALFENQGAIGVALAIDEGDDSNKNGVVVGERVEFRGLTSKRARVNVVVEPIDSEFQTIGSERRTLELTSDAMGEFAFEESLFVGMNRVKTSITDAIGRQQTFTREFVRGDIVSDWNAALLNVVRDWRGTSDDPVPGRVVMSAPPRVARNLALVHTAMFDAINGVEGGFASYSTTVAAPAGASAIAAGATAAYEVAISLYPDAKERVVWDATLAESLALVDNASSRELGVEYGKEVARALIASRAGDGANVTIEYTPSDEPGFWNRTSSAGIPPLLPHWGDVTPFAVAAIEPYVAPPPPALDSAEYAASVDEVMRLGRVDSATRTAEQSQIALFWADGGGTATPPGHWNRIAANVSLMRGDTMIERARTFALLNMALFDAGIASWNAKYEYELWRPIDAIRRANEDGNEATVADATWTPLVATPPFPAYTSGHSTFSNAGAAVLEALYGDIAFASRADGRTGVGQLPTESVVTRRFAGFTEAAAEAGMSRIYGGIHFDFDNVEGQVAGSAVGEWVVNNRLKPEAGQ